jgi:hypothetical protein
MNGLEFPGQKRQTAVALCGKEKICVVWFGLNFMR